MAWSGPSGRDAEGEDRLRAVLLARPEDGGGEGGLVRRVRVVLGLEAEPGAAGVGPAPLALQGPVQEVAAVELQARLRGGDVEDDAQAGVRHPRGVDQPGPLA